MDSVEPITGAGVVVARSDVEWRRRVMIFGESIRSDFENPVATSCRAIMRALTRAGHEVVFIEPRRSESLTRLLRHRGSRPLRQFAEHYPDLQYRTLDLPRGRELSIWLARELALIDAVVVLDNASQEIRRLISDYDEPRLLRVLPGPSGMREIGSDQSIAFGPAVDTSAGSIEPAEPGERTRTTVLAWDAEQSSLATRAWHTVASLDPDAKRYSLGSLTLDGWVPVTELDLQAVLATADLAVVVSDLHPAGPSMAVRSLVPWSFGIRTVTVAAHPDDAESELPGPVVTVDELADVVPRARHLPWPDLSRWSAGRQAAALIAAIDQRRRDLGTKRA